MRETTRGRRVIASPSHDLAAASVSISDLPSVFVTRECDKPGVEVHPRGLIDLKKVGAATTKRALLEAKK